MAEQINDEEMRQFEEEIQADVRAMDAEREEQGADSDYEARCEQAEHEERISTTGLSLSIGKKS